MQRERIAEGIHVLTCERYFEVTAGVIVTNRGVIIVDTFPFPAESQALREFAEAQETGPIRYVILTHSHADHSYGSYLFPEADLISQDLCRTLIEKMGQEGLRKAREETPELAQVRLRLPNITVESEGAIHLGQYSIDLIHTPGHTRDGLTAYVREEKIAFAGDVVMPIPYIPHGDPEDLVQSLKRLKGLSIDHLVQGHGEPLLRGEVGETLDSSIKYLNAIQKRVRQLVERGAPPTELEGISIESCGKSRVPLGGLAEQLHRLNLQYLYNRYRAELLR